MRCTFTPRRMQRRLCRGRADAFAREATPAKAVAFPDFVAPGGPLAVFGGGALFGVFFFALGLALALPDRELAAAAPDQFTPV